MTRSAGARSNDHSDPRYPAQAQGRQDFVDPAKAGSVPGDKVKAIELSAEQLQQEALYAFTQSGPLGKPAEPPAAARGNVAAYETAMAKTFPKNVVDVLLAGFASAI